MAMTPVPMSGGNAMVAQMKGAVSNVMRMGNQPALRRAMPAILMLGVAVLAVGGWLLLREPARMVLFPGLAEADKALVMDALGSAGINATIDSMTGQVEVPSADYHRARMQLASQGLPQSLPDANDVLTELPMGASRSVEGARLRQAQELDLARSIAEISAVAQARVHLALPEKSAFLRDTQPPKASVFLQLAPGRVLEASQVEAIVNLVSTSVPGMARGDVSVVDQMGRLLSRGSDDPVAQVSDRQLQHRLEVERLYRERIEALLTPIAGPGNLSVQVTVDMDFTQSQITEERVDPAATALRSEQSELVESSEPEARGIPGAVANAPPNQADLVPAGEATGALPLAGAITNRSSGTTKNYEVSRTVETTQPATAQITRISAAILMRAIPPATPVEEGAPPAPLLPADLKADLEMLAQSAIGFDEARGDTITITAQPFMDAVMVEAPTDLSWLPEVLRQLGLIALIAIVALGIIRPLLTRANFSGEAAAGSGGMNLGGLGGVEVAAGDSLDDVQARLEARRTRLASAALGANVTREEKFAVLRQIVAEDPGRIASVLQRMMKDDMDRTPGA
ncbi:MAG: flagellar basal-body MS-ring/collar protein FliF [Fuscovulum sp.]|nr:MAG: flagellar basal-body MS-ring/collar protein FliF [Fuscovulum sp.]